jgi:hypothetical protein
MTSDHSEGDWSLDSDEVGVFGRCEHDYWCARCGKPYGSGGTAASKVMAFVFGTAVGLILMSPVFWLLRVSLSWAF